MAERFFLKELSFKSTVPTDVRDITPDITAAVQKSEVQNGFVLVNSKHTTLGLIINEMKEPKLLEDFIKHVLTEIPEDKRSTKISPLFLEKYPTADYLHACADNPDCDETDIDWNAASHLRHIAFTQPTVSLPIREGRLELGKYQQVAIVELDGRDGRGVNPARTRIVQIWIYPFGELKIL